MRMFKVEEIANYFIEKGIAENTPVNPMKLQKLLYFSYGWFYALEDKKLFDAEIQAWQYGPVIAEIYHEVKKFGNSAIDKPIQKFFFGDSIFSVGLGAATIDKDKNKEVVSFLDAMWQVYNKYSAIQLSEATHAVGTPWHTLGIQYSNNFPNHLVIDDQMIKEYFLAEKAKLTSK